MLTRRNLLVNGVGVAALTRLAPGLLSPRGAGSEERVLVVLQLSGGNDGLNTVVPFRQDDYFRQRPTLAQPPAAPAPTGATLRSALRLDLDRLDVELEQLAAEFDDLRAELEVHGLAPRFENALRHKAATLETLRLRRERLDELIAKVRTR